MASGSASSEPRDPRPETRDPRTIEHHGAPCAASILGHAAADLRSRYDGRLAVDDPARGCCLDRPSLARPRPILVVVHGVAGDGYILAVLAAVELVNDKLPFTPSRLTPVPLGARIVAGGLVGATLAAASQQSLAVGALIGAAGGLAGSYAGYHARRALVTKVGLPDFAVALIEDAITIATSILIATRV